MSLFHRLKHRGDESDARHLAHILRLGLLPEGHIMPRVVRAVRDLARKRMQLAQLRTAQILSIETLFDQQRGAHLSSNNTKNGNRYLAWAFQANTLMKAVSMFKLEATSGHQNGTAEPAQHVASPSPAKRRTISATAIARVKNAPKLAKAADNSEEWKEF